MATWILIIWFGAGHSQAFDTSQYQNEATCLTAKDAILAAIKETGYHVSGYDVFQCIRVPSP